MADVRVAPIGILLPRSAQRRNLARSQAPNVEPLASLHDVVERMIATGHDSPLTSDML